MNKPELKEHHISCRSDSGQRCDCGAREWNLACGAWERYIKEYMIKATFSDG